MAHMVNLQTPGWWLVGGLYYPPKKMGIIIHSKIVNVSWFLVEALSSVGLVNFDFGFMACVYIYIDIE